MTAAEVLNEFRAAGAFLEGHFILTSGLESPLFIQKVFVFQDP
jgi:orotate phosphoribosyltransferase